MIYFDCETFSATPINHGSYRYVEDCELMLATYAFDDGPVQVWDRTAGEKMPGDLDYALHDESELICAHSSMFDRNVLRYAMKINIPIERWRDTMVKALAHGLPGALEKLGDILGIAQDQKKLKDGKQLIQLFCKPRAKNSKLRRATHATHPEEWRRFIEYARLDIEAMRAIDRKLPVWNYEGTELALWHLDQSINDRGLCVDLELAESAIRAVARAQKTLANKTQDLTNGKVDSTNQRDKLLAHILAEYGVTLPDMQGATIERRVNDPDLPLELRELLAVRLQAATSSTSKYSALKRGVNKDGRLRGTMQFDGAARTGRWAHRAFQPGNLFRPDMEHAEINLGIDAMKADCEDLVFDNVMRVAANAIRGCIIAPPGKKLVVSDLSNIEGRDAAWLAGEMWKLKAFRDYDAKLGPDLYIMAYARAFNVAPSSIDKSTIEGYLKRQIGKVMELMLQYQGGVGAFITGADTYDINLEEMAAAALPTIPQDVIDEAEGFLRWLYQKAEERHTKRLKKNDDLIASLATLEADKLAARYGLSERVFIACDSLKRLWRRAHPRIESYWPELENAARAAILTPGQAFTARKLKFQRDGAWLRMQLPRGDRYLCYASPQVDENGKISYMGINQYSRQWSRLHTYGGKLFENACQAVARDVMAVAMQPLEDAGYELLLSIHDELVTETPDTEQFSHKHMSELLATNPAWAAGLPLAAAGFETKRYYKAA